MTTPTMTTTYNYDYYDYYYARTTTENLHLQRNRHDSCIMKAIKYRPSWRERHLALFLLVNISATEHFRLDVRQTVRFQLAPVSCQLDGNFLSFAENVLVHNKKLILGRLSGSPCRIIISSHFI